MTSAAFITFISAIDASKQRQKAEKERMEQQRQQQRRQLTRHSMDVSAGRAAGNGPAHNHHGLHRNSSSRHGHAHGPSNSRAAAPSDKILRPLRRQSSSISSTHTAAAAGAGQHHDSSVASAQGCEHISGSPPDTAAVQANVTAPAPAP